jgi:hypothetical protein
MRIRFGIRQEAPIVLGNDRKELSARTWHSSLLLRLLLLPRPLRTRDASSLHSVRGFITGLPYRTDVQHDGIKSATLVTDHLPS